MYMLDGGELCRRFTSCHTSQSGRRVMSCITSAFEGIFS